MSTSRYRYQIVITGCALLGVVLAGGVVYYATRMIHAQALESVQRKQRSISYSQNKKIFEAERDAVTILTTRIETNERTIVTAASIPTLLSSLEALGATHKVPVVITNAQTTGKQKDKLFVSFTGAGQLQALQAFLEALEHQTYQTKVTKLSIYVDPDVKGQWLMQGEIQIMSFGL